MIDDSPAQVSRPAESNSAVSAWHESLPTPTEEIWQAEAVPSEQGTRDVSEAIPESTVVEQTRAITMAPDGTEQETVSTGASPITSEEQEEALNEAGAIGAPVEPHQSWDGFKSAPNVESKSRWPVVVAVLFMLVVVTTALGFGGWFWWSRRAALARSRQTTTTAKPGPTIPVAPEGMVYVKGGTFLMGRDDGDEYERPAHEVTVSAFFIDKYEVTCEQYQKFIDATHRSAPPNWKDGAFPPGTAKLPVSGVTWDDANAFAEWTGKRLPTEEEWEFAARGNDGRRYPWGNEWNPNATNSDDSSANRLSEVGSYADGKSPSGAMDMTGNAWEWTASDLVAYPGGRLPSQPAKDVKVIRGGSWKEDKNQATTTYRGFLAARGAKDYSATGFRCVKDVAITTSASQNAVNK